jgi:hypothetical protein
MNNPSSHIRFLNRREIDPEKWDRCIQNAPNGKIYARSFYLDAMAKNWSALISGDYELVMPLTWNRKFGFTYLYQPAFTAQLGLFSIHPERLSEINFFISEAKKYYKFCEIHLNHQNEPENCPLRANYILSLDKSYEDLRKNYKKRLLENLAEADRHALTYFSTTDFPVSLELFKSTYSKRFTHVKNQDYTHFTTLCRELLKRDMLFVRQARDALGNILSSGIFFRDSRRIYNIMSVTVDAGRAQRANFFLMDHLIQEFSSRNTVLDFEGSELPGIAEFYRKFGSLNQPYPFLRFNHLPFPFRYFK